jgi:hypothetical protein
MVVISQFASDCSYFGKSTTLQQPTGMCLEAHACKVPVCVPAPPGVFLPVLIYM